MKVSANGLIRSALIAGLMFGPTLIHADAVSRGAMLAVSCAGCHGTDGRSPGEMPTIAGKSADFIVNALKDFRDGKIPSTVMGRHAKGYSDEEIQLIGKYFAAK